MANLNLRPFKDYLRSFTAVLQQGDAREESFYPALAQLFSNYAQESDRADVRVTTQPRKTEGGNPDFRIWQGIQHRVGYVEAKAPHEHDLQRISETEQLRRYRHTFPNLILTNFCEFRLYRDSELVDSVRIARPFVATKLGKVPPLENVEEFIALLSKFFAFSLPRTYTAESLAVELAKYTRHLRDEVVSQELEQEKEEGKGDLLGFYEAFQEYLIGGLKLEEFADLYAQTITYGLFAARIRSGEGFTRRSAFETIPHTIGILRDLFRFISLGDLPTSLEWIVDDIAEVLAVADVGEILHRFFHEGKGADPIVHFYETFLKHYDPQERERRGVYYTPEPVVSYIVRSLHQILKDKFGKSDGLAGDGVTLLDPAAGTMTFIAKATQVATEEFVSKYGEGSRESFLHDHVLQNFYAFELMMAPYAVGHLKMAFFLEELGYTLKPEERVKFYLTNTLEMEELEQSRLPGFSALAEESHLAGKVKKETPILVILGNPPYSGISSNTGEWITALIEDYKYVDGKHFGEKKHWLQDDYVKFLRFAEWKIAQSGEGVIGMITNHGYLDNPTFRGMRWHLMQTFDEIYVLDLHGNSLKKELCPDGSKDENVFDIQQGVVISFFVKRGNTEEVDAVVRHAELYGTREAKYASLDAHDQGCTDWAELNPKSPFYFFVPRDEEHAEQYRKFISVPEIFPVKVTGILTARDKLTIDFDQGSLLAKIRILQDRTLTDDYIQEYLAGLLGRARSKVENYAWRISAARASLQKVANLKEHVIPILYRPFDNRKIFYHDSVVWRTRVKVMRHMLAGENVALLVKRQGKRHPYSYVFVANLICESCVFESAYANNSVLPLYLYPSADRNQLFSHHELTERQPNLNPTLVATLAEAYGSEPSPEEIFQYIYATLHSNVYREKYAESLRTDFPRIPFTSDHELFEKLAALGKRLVDLHLLCSDEIDPPIAKFEGDGDGIVQTGKNGLRYESKTQRVFINKTQYFEGIPLQVWEYQIGGYQVCHKWLKDRKDRHLSLDEIRTYCQIVTALAKTAEAQAAIDELYPLVEETLLAISSN